MYIIDKKDGKLREGIELSEEEVAIYESIPNDINAAIGIGYISAIDRQRIGALLISLYRISRRETPTPTTSSAPID